MNSYKEQQMNLPWPISNMTIILMGYRGGDQIDDKEYYS